MDSMDWQQLLLKHIVPGLGAIIATIMYFSPFQAVVRVRSNNQLGDLNALPFVAILHNCAGWVIYSCVVRDLYVALANLPGLLMGAFYVYSCYGFATRQVRDNMMIMSLSFTALQAVVGVVMSLALVSQEQQIWGWTCIAILVVYYGAPLTELFNVIKTRSSATLYWPMALMNTINGSLWTAYGLAISDYFIMGPNLLGAVFGAITLILCLVFPSGRGKRSEGEIPTEPKAVESNEQLTTPLVDSTV